jgi:hypothetical protein
MPIVMLVRVQIVIHPSFLFLDISGHGPCGCRPTPFACSGGTSPKAPLATAVATHESRFPVR